MYIGFEPELYRQPHPSVPRNPHHRSHKVRKGATKQCTCCRRNVRHDGVCVNRNCVKFLKGQGW